MASVNKVILVGNLGRDPDTRHMPSGDAITNLAVATTDKWKDKASGEQKEATEWHRVATFGKLAEIAGQYLKKGSQVYIEGKLKTRKYTDKEGVERYATEIVADTMQMLGSRNAGPGAGSSHESQESYGQDSRPAAQGNRAPAKGARPAARQGSGGAGAPASSPARTADGMDFDDEIPFIRNANDEYRSRIEF